MDQQEYLDRLIEKCNTTETLDQCVKDGYDFNTQDDCGQETYLHFLLDYDDEDDIIYKNAMVKFLQMAIPFMIKNGFKINTKCEHGCTPLHLVHNKSLIHLMVINGADLEARDVDGYTPLRRAVNRSDITMFSNLEYLGANFESRDNIGISIFESANFILKNGKLTGVSLDNAIKIYNRLLALTNKKRCRMKIFLIGQLFQQKSAGLLVGAKICRGFLLWSTKAFKF